ncbi:hypothetical protein F5B21DRAFT_503959 [Xylaria acuta]|nr:hypothetical protein F5B21DRAFT_503959 [Xylaria acuta]
MLVCREVKHAGFEWINSLLLYAHRTRAMPRIDHNHGAFDLASVQACCNDRVKELLRNTPSDDATTYVNNFSGVVMPMAQMTDTGLEKVRKGYEEQWVKAVFAEGTRHALATVIEIFNEAGEEKYPKLLGDAVHLYILPL